MDTLDIGCGQNLLGNSSHSLSDVFYIAGKDTRHGNASVLSHVYVVILDHGFTLCGSKASVRKHSDLVGNVGPFGFVVRFHSLAQKLAHVNDAVSHAFALVLPL